MAAIEPSGPQAAPRLALVPHDASEAITFMFKAYGEYPDQIRILAYLEVLEDFPAVEIWRAAKVWMRQPHDRAAKPGELYGIINQTHTRLAEKQEARERAEIERQPPTEASRLDAIYQELLAEQPHNEVLRERIADRARLRAMGKLLNGQAEVAALLGSLVTAKEMPHGQAQAETGGGDDHL